MAGAWQDPFPASALLSRQQPRGTGCDVGYDTFADIPDEVRAQKGFGEEDVSIEGCMERVQAETPHLDIVIHSVAFSPEISSPHLNVSRQAYLTAMSISSYSLVALTRAALPLMKGREGAVVGLSYLASNHVVPFYGGGMATAKAALECDARYLSWFVGEEGHRVNLVSAGPYASRAARSIGDMATMVSETANRSPLRRPRARRAAGWSRRPARCVLGRVRVGRVPVPGCVGGGPRGRTRTARHRRRRCRKRS